MKNLKIKWNRDKNKYLECDRDKRTMEIKI